MFERYTEEARQAIVIAQEEARILRHNYIGTEHLLLALLREEHGGAAQALRSHGFTLDEMRARVTRIVGSGEEVPSTQLPFTPRSKKVLELAAQEALARNDNHIGTEHLLLGLLREDNGVAARILTESELEADALRRELGERRASSRKRNLADVYRRRLPVLDAYLAAAGRRDEVVRAIGDAASTQLARAAVQELLGLSREQAEAVLDLRLSRLTRDRVRSFERERRELVRRLEELEGDDAEGSG